MKNLTLVMFVLAVLLFHNLSNEEFSLNTERTPASVKNEESFKLNKYVFTYKNMSLELIKKDQENSFSEAAKECYSYFNNKIKFNKEDALDIIDSCVNPKVE